jgi:hypothetical protein
MKLHRRRLLLAQRQAALDLSLSQVFTLVVNGLGNVLAINRNINIANIPKPTAFKICVMG